MLRPIAGTALVSHRGCLDGTGSALVFLWAGGRRDRILFKNPSGLILAPEDLPPDVIEVWYADCCPPDMLDPAVGRPFRVFDHHISNQRLFGHDDRCVFDMTQSGTSLLARVLDVVDGRSHALMQARRDLVEALEAYDLGRFDHEQGMRLADAASSYSQEDMLDLMFSLGPYDVLRDPDLSARAHAIQSMRVLYADSALRSVRYSTTFFSGIGDVRIGVGASPVYWKNEVAERILSSGHADVAVVIDVTGGMVSLRARRGGPDCSRIAALFGGGGHARASGFKLGSDRMIRMLTEQVLG